MDETSDDEREFARVFVTPHSFQPETVIVTGGAGFIGGAVVRHLLRSECIVVNLDKLTYVGNLESLEDVASDHRYHFVRGDICDSEQVRNLLETFRPFAIVHLAAESHVDRSIDGPREFIQTNVLGTFVLLEEARRYWQGLRPDYKDRFRFQHISTDEVFGSLGPTGAFSEASPYTPNSPYSASKASSDHLVRAWHHTFELPTTVTNCSNNYGPYQFPEKLIPLIILNAVEGRPLPIYGTGDNVRDWLYVDDHARAICLVLERGTPGETYNVGGGNELSNLQVIEEICAILDDELSGSTTCPHKELITYVDDRPGHDKRYAIDSTKIFSELGWEPKETFRSGLRKTVNWYLQNLDW